MNKALGIIATAIISFILGGFIISSFKPPVSTVPLPNTVFKSTQIETPQTFLNGVDLDMITLINQARILAEVPEVTENELLDKTAMIKACDMRDRNYFEHEDPDGQMPWHLFKEVGYEYLYAGENLVKGTTVPVSDMFYLMASKGHRANILNPDYREVGIATCGIYTVQHFGTRQ